jgi:tRNA (cmo5U34)-methyltransferase
MKQRIAAMDKIKQHFEEEAREFDRVILTLIPEYPRMVEALISAIPFEHCAPIRAIDLGCGTGTIAANILETFPNAKVTCFDLAENMLAMARVKLAHYPHVRYIQGDFSGLEFGEEYDMVVSSLSLHHLVTDEDKHRFYRKIYNALVSGGIFYNADVVLGSNDSLQEVYMQQWRNFMGRTISKDEIERKWIPKYQAEDHPARLIDQLKWMEEIGFADVDVLWKCYNFAVYGGVKA